MGVLVWWEMSAISRRIFSRSAAICREEEAEEAFDKPLFR